MKKRIAILLSLLMVLTFSLAACGGGSGDADLSDSKYVGTWKAESVSIGEDAGDLDGGVFTLTLNGDGTGTFDSVGDDGTEETSDVTWELTSDGFRTKGDTKLKFTDDGDNIKTKIIGVDLIFEKQ